MINLLNATRLRRVLLIGAHSDDIELGCGGTVLTLLAANPSLELTWVVLSGNEARHTEARAAAEAFCGMARLNLVLHSFKDGYFPYDPTVKDAFESLKTAEPDLIFTHRADDAHQDHRTVAQLTGNTFRNHMVLEYEIPKYDGDLARPNAYMPLNDEVITKKCSLLMEHFGTQRSKRWFSEDTFRGLARLRGVECQQSFAEGYFARKFTL